MAEGREVRFLLKPDEDWRCAFCNFVNYAKRYLCRNCTRCFNESFPWADWRCGSCRYINFSSRRRCRRCSKTCGESYRGVEEDWSCGTCSHVNCFTRKNCNLCYQPRVPENKEPPASTQDFWCTKCNNASWACKEGCTSAGTPAPASTPTPPPPPDEDAPSTSTGGETHPVRRGDEKKEDEKWDANDDYWLLEEDSDDDE